MNKELQEKAMKIIEEGNVSYLSKMARDCESTEFDVANVLPYEICALSSGENFDSIWAEITTWESCLFVQRNLGSVLELSGKLPEGKHGRGFFNLAHGPEYCVSGHLKVDDITNIAFVSFPETKMPSIAFFNENNETKFTIYTGFTMVDDKVTMLESAKESFLKIKEQFAKKD